MAGTAALRVRRSLTDVQDDYSSGNKAELEALWRAWKGIKELPPENPNSFFMIGGYHGEPFRGAGWGSSAYWGGYCNHGNVLFPTWHRAYLLRAAAAPGDVPSTEQGGQGDERRADPAEQRTRKNAVEPRGILASPAAMRVVGCSAARISGGGGLTLCHCS